MRYYVLFFLLSIVAYCYGQVTDDPLSVEASIHTHKRTGSTVLGRSLEEKKVKEEMDKVREKVIDYRFISDELDKYQEVFVNVENVLNMVASAGAITQDIVVIVQRVKDIYSLLDEFKEQCQKRGIDPKQALAVFTSTGPIIDELGKDVESIYKDLIGYGQSLATKSLSTSLLLKGVNEVGTHVHTIRVMLDRYYRDLYFLIALRRTYWNPAWSHFMVQTKPEYCSDAIGRWHQAMSDNLESFSK